MYILSSSLNMLQFSNKTHTVLILIHVKSVSLTAKHFFSELLGILLTPNVKKAYGIFKVCHWTYIDQNFLCNRRPHFIS